MAGYDMIPWKLVFCEVDWDTCEGLGEGKRIRIDELPAPPEPGRVPAGADHVHVRIKLSADQRDARGDHQWRSLLLSTARCEHGRIQQDRCFDCPGGFAPTREGERIGTTYGGQAVVIPDRQDHHKIKAWVRD